MPRKEQEERFNYLVQVYRESVLGVGSYTKYYEDAPN
jgi:hypothetical protein